ncbi:MAG: ABC transporter substrate-binding protein [Candidatus Cryosericum sp.]
MIEAGMPNKLDEHVKSKAGLWMIRSTRTISSVLVAVIFLSLFTLIAPTYSNGTVSAASMRRIAVELAAGQSSFAVTVGSKRVSGKFPAGFTPFKTASGIAFPLRSVVEAAGGTVRFEKAQNTVYFAIGPVMGAYDLGKKSLVDGTYATSTRKDLFRVVGKTGTLYLTDMTLKSLVSQAGGTLLATAKIGTSTIVCQVPSTVKDALGSEHDAFPAKAGKMRVVTLAPNLAENCFALGQGSNIIATSEYTDFPEEAKKIPTVGAFSSPSLEKLLVLSPDLILVTDGTPLAVVDRLKKMGRSVYADDPQSLAAIVGAIRQLAVVLGVPDRGFEVALSMHRAIARVADAAANLSRKPSVYVEIWNSPLMSAGKGTFVSDLVAVAGGTNIGDETNNAWPTLSEEFVIGHNPDIIIVASGMGAGDVSGRSAFSTVKAVKLGQVYDMVGDYIFRPSPRIIQGLELIADYVQRAARH